MDLGDYRVSVHNHGFFRLDGGAMFGSVPKNLWAKVAPPDDQNRILLGTRSLVIESRDRKLLVDVGCGDKWSQKNRSIFGIEEGEYKPVPGVTDVLLTHLHFDHAGGVSRSVGEKFELCYPGAKHYVSRANFENARNPNVRERASYLRENIEVLAEAEVRWLSPDQELMPGLSVHQSDGHTHGLLWVKLTAGGVTVAFPSDLIPTSAHLPVPFAMGYDICAERSMHDKQIFLEQAVHGNWVVVFEHDPEIDAGQIGFDDKGRPYLTERLELSNNIST